ncbi:superkiller complex protein 2 isoform X2 [Phymastichus coffea]|uniref:superkiller complex protein 2 isoform X2 n=1 Tax=Phymastichus coffea TaxID=108790 RepID=UPI00273C1E14|nr:superkiller complex protein 2 isoform X2 [Phymastichus coffea]
MAGSDERDYLEMPFGPPPILSDIKTELKEYIVYPEKLPIHQLDRVQQYWDRNPDVLLLLHTDLAPAGTTLKYERDPITGCLGELQEVDIESVGQNVRNSMSMSRAPGPAIEGVKGNVSNFLFWPGGFDEPKSSDSPEQIEIDFENNLKTLAKGFKSGIEFMADNCTPKGLSSASEKSKVDSICTENSDDLLSVIDKEGHSVAFWPRSTENEEKENNNHKNNENITLPNIDDVIEPFKERKIPVLKISESVPKTNLKTKWAEQIDINVPVTDFDKKIVEPAMAFPYELDNFQKQAILKLEEQCDVFVAAHTSAGKTTIAEYAIAISQKHMTRTIYTSPIKALSNQKFREFKEKFDNVGLITGDLQINANGTCLIMTTEILKSMLYCAAEVIRDVEYVVFDEVHYINNEDRGHVWEEVIILLPPTVRIVMLSATVPNPLEFAHWVGQIKKRKMYVISTIKRPVPLQHYLYTGYDKKSKDQIFLLIDKDGGFKRNSIKQAKAAKEEGLAKQAKLQQTKYQYAKQKPALVMKPVTAVLKNASVEETVSTVAALEEEEEKLEDKIRANVITTKEKRIYNALLEYLQSNGLLPVVVFTLSRNRCDKTAESFTESLLTHQDQMYVKEFFKKSVRHLKGTDVELPQVLRMQRLLTLGIGIHHSGILPILKEIVEMLFQKGIVKVLFATETFAMGVNMPAKTVVFDSIEKYDGSSFRNLLPTEYIQMAGRAGRRGHDDTGLQKKTHGVLYKVFLLTSLAEEEAATSDNKSDLWYDMISLIKTQFYKPKDNPTHEIVFVPATAIIEVTNVIANVNTRNIFADWEKRQIPRFKDATPGPSCQSAVEELIKITTETFSNPSFLFPFVELKLNCFELQTKDLTLHEVAKNLEEIKNRIVMDSNFEEEFEQVFKHKELEQKQQDLFKTLSDEYLSNYPEYEARVKVLRELKYIDSEDRVTLKGRVALEMGTYEILLTELVLDNILTNYHPEEIAAILSSLVFQHRSNDEENEYKELPRLNELQNKMTKVYKRLVKIETEHGLEPIAQPDFHLIRVVYEWARAKSFAKIMKLTDIQEGIIVRCIQQLNETLQDVKNAAIIIGHPALKEKMEEASTKIKRDIVFTASLYIQD